MKHLILLVPAYNEESCILETLHSLPRHLPGWGRVSVWVIDDGSTDNTIAEAEKGNPDRIIALYPHQGLGRALFQGMKEAYRAGADAMVIYDADGQYKVEDIPRLLQAMEDKKADIVLGDRIVRENPHFPWIKRVLQEWGSRVVKWVSGIEVSDATTGFRALSRRAMGEIFIFSRYTYTLEMLIQAGVHHLAVESISITTNPPKRPSRLFRSLPEYIAKAGWTMVRMFVLYRPLLAFFLASVPSFLGGSFLFLRFFYYFLMGQGQGHIQSLIVGSVLFFLTFLLWALAFLGDSLFHQRQLLESLLQKMDETTASSDSPPPPPEKSS